MWSLLLSRGEHRDLRLRVAEQQLNELKGCVTRGAKNPDFDHVLALVERWKQEAQDGAQVQYIGKRFWAKGVASQAFLRRGRDSEVFETAIRS